MTGVERPSRLDYELYILHSMVAAPVDRVTKALEVADVDRAAMAASYNFVKQQNYMLRPAFEEVSRILHPPRVEDVREVDGRECVVRSFALRFWGDFLFDVYGAADGMVWDERFRRAPESVVPRVETPAQLQPWQVVKEDVEAIFGPLEEAELWSPYAAYSLFYPTPDGMRTEYQLTFSWGLLQQVQVVE